MSTVNPSDGPVTTIPPQQQELQSAQPAQLYSNQSREDALNLARAQHAIAGGNQAFYNSDNDTVLIQAEGMAAPPGFELVEAAPSDGPPTTAP